jgi:KRAB domain-containing zinc finger protein
MREHVETHIKPEHRPRRVKRFECDFCSKRFFDKVQLRTHMMSQHMAKEKLFKCNQCKYSGITKSYLKMHMIVHNKSFKCTKCDKLFRNKAYLAAHLNKHTLPDVKEFVCHCKKTFKSSRSLTLHRINFHKEKPAGNYVCKTCNYATLTATHLKRHEAKHVKEFKCHNCSKSFAFDKLLQIHLNYEPTHRFYCFKDRDFTCKICEKVYLNRRLLKRHSLSHAEHVQCTICQQFKSASSIKSHIKSHKIKDQEPKFSCELCSKTFHFNGNLRKHYRVHKNKSVVCDFCGQKVSSKKKLAAHLKVHLPKPTWKCQICLTTFKQSYSLKRHYTRFHKK